MFRLEDEEQPLAAALPETETDELYSRDYFHGQTSGYPETGYPNLPETWIPWLDLLGTFKQDGVLLDIGCAYGYLVEAARRRGYRGFGVDISRFALAQVPELQGHLIRGDGQRLPFRDGCADLVLLFDVLEHLENPRDCLAEAARVLKRDGLIAGATPDPVFFSRPEPTHIFERPPSFWIALLEELQLKVHFRISVEPYNFQFLATPRNSPLSGKISNFQHDYLSAEPDFIQAAPSLTALPRWGWGALKDQRRRLQPGGAALYLLNRGPDPLQIRVRFKLNHSPDFSRLRLRLGSYVLGDFYLGSEKLEHEIELQRALLPAGGHHLFFDLDPDTIEADIAELRIDAEPAPSGELLESLPFDVFQRYELSARISTLLAPASILDVGGYIGDQHGHLAMPQDFFQRCPGARIVTTDLRACDHPAHVPAVGWELPMEAESFDLVVSLDVLEHISPDRRTEFLKELDRLSRRWILLGAPFSSPEAMKAESILAGTVLGQSQFLAEHQELGLPRADLVLDFFGSSKGYQILPLPNGFLPRWIAMQVLTQHYFELADYHITTAFNRLYNSSCFEADQQEPAYRTLFLVSKEPLVPSLEAELRALLKPESALGRSCFEEPSLPQELAALHQRSAELLRNRESARRDLQFLINERQKLIGLLTPHRPGWRHWLGRLRNLLGHD